MRFWTVVVGSLAFALIGSAEAKKKGNQKFAALDKILEVEEKYGIKFSGNREVHDYIIETSKGEMPQRLENFHSDLNRNNMKRRLFQIYKWSEGRGSNRAGYEDWLDDLA